MRVCLVVAVLVPALFWGGTASAEETTVEFLEILQERFHFFIVLNDAEGEPERFVYADRRDHVHVYRFKDGAAKVDWETTNLGSGVRALLVTDLDQNGRLDVVIGTAGGRIQIYDLDDYDLVWENLQDPFSSIRAMTSANIDRDPQQELIFIADQYLFIYDGARHTLEWQSRDEFSAEEMLTGNVDNDEQLEVILNSGVVFDSRFYKVQYKSETRFGERIRLLDLNGDGIPEVVGEAPDFTIRVFDIYAERELW